MYNDPMVEQWSLDWEEGGGGGGQGGPLGDEQPRDIPVEGDVVRSDVVGVQDHAGQDQGAPTIYILKKVYLYLYIHTYIYIFQ